VEKVSKSLEINETPETSVFNGNAEKIIIECIKVIESKYKDKKTRELLKYYVAHSFFEDYDLESNDSFEDRLIN